MSPYFHNREVDIWAVGCLYSEMMTGDPLFPGESDIDQLYLITQMLGLTKKEMRHFLAFGNLCNFCRFSGPLCARHRQLMSRNPMFAGLNIQGQQQQKQRQIDAEQFPKW